MSPTCFNQLVGSRGFLPIMVQKSKQLTKWLQANFQGRHRYLFAEDILAAARDRSPKPLVPQ